MCIIICCDKKSGHIDMKMLKSAEAFNQDGMGMAWINRNNMVEWKKGLNAKQIKKLIHKIKPSLKKGYIVHARIASIGSVCPQLTHPFEISIDANDSLEGITDKGVLFHNGTWTEYKDIVLSTLVANKTRMYEGENSDSRSMAFLAHMYGVSVLNLISDQKIAILTPRGIKRFGKFPQVDKHYCSNDYIKYNNNKSNLMYDEFDYDVWGYKGTSNNYGSNDTSYCASCDRNLKEKHFSFDYDECDECYKRRTQRDIDNVIDEHYINAKQYMNKYDKGAMP